MVEGSPSGERLALIVLGLYTVLTTVRASRPLNPLCTRDFVDPSAQGTCLCGDRQFCLCTPSLASDVIIELEDADGKVNGVVFIERSDGRGLAMVGGFVRVGESSEAAAAREALEETGLAVTQLRQWCVFSEPSRDPRRHTAALVFVARARGTPKASDDAKGDKPLAVNSTRFFLMIATSDSGSDPTFRHSRRLSLRAAQQSAAVRVRPRRDRERIP